MDPVQCRTVVMFRVLVGGASTPSLFHPEAASTPAATTRALTL